MVQLLSDEKEAHFAIRYSDEPDSLLYCTSEAIPYTKILDQAELLQDLKYAWDFALRVWVGNYIDSRSKSDETMGHFSRIHSAENDKAKGTRNSNRPVSDGRQKPRLRCHYCRLAFFTERKRSDHESEWHAHRKGAIRASQKS